MQAWAVIRLQLCKCAEGACQYTCNLVRAARMCGALMA